MVARILLGLYLLSFISCSSSSDEEKTVYTCRYTNRYAGPDCKEYIGSRWNDLAEIEADCGAGFVELEASIVEGACPDSVSVSGEEKPPKGVCHAEKGTPEEYDLYSYEGDHGTLESACQSYMKGEWEAMGSDDQAAEIRPALPEAMAALESTDTVTVSSTCKDNDCLMQMIEANETFDFTPTGGSPKAGFVFYPGGKVDPRSYAPSAMAIAEAGIFVSIVPMKDYLAINGHMRADDVRAANPKIEQWFVGGHSLGGAMTARYGASASGQTARGLIIWASIADKEFDVSESGLPVLSIYGSLDTGNNQAQVKAYAPNLPEDTVYICIEAGDHGQFGHYEDEHPPGIIPREEQQKQIIDATVGFIRDPTSLTSSECQDSSR